MRWSRTKVPNNHQREPIIDHLLNKHTKNHLSRFYLFWRSVCWIYCTVESTLPRIVLYFWRDIHIFWWVNNFLGDLIVLTIFGFIFQISKSWSFLSSKFPSWSFLFSSQIIEARPWCISFLFEIRSFFSPYLIIFWFFFNLDKIWIMASRSRIFRVEIKKLVLGNGFWNRKPWGCIEDIDLLIMILDWSWSFLVFIERPSIWFSDACSRFSSIFRAIKSGIMISGSWILFFEILHIVHESFPLGIGGCTSRGSIFIFQMWIILARGRKFWYLKGN